MPPLRFGPQPLEAKQAKRRRAEGAQKPTATRATPRKAETHKTQHSTSSSRNRFKLESAGRSSPRKQRQSMSPKAHTRKVLTPGMISSPPQRKVSKSGQGSQTLSRKRPFSNDTRQLFDGALSDAEHVERHAFCKGFCIRCDMHRRPQVYEACSLHEGRSWLARGVSRGTWGLGCKICARFAATGRRCEGARFSKFAKFEIRPTTGFHARMLLEQHSRSQSHRAACRATEWRTRGAVAQPTASQPLARSTAGPTEKPREPSATESDSGLLRGNVPSPQQWQEAWAALSEGVSLRKAGRIRDKESRAQTASGKQVNRVRKRQRQQLQVMAEVLRKKTSARRCSRRPASVWPSTSRSTRR